MVSRRKNPDDNRETFVSLTDEGRHRIDGYKAEKDILIRQILEGFSEEEIHNLAGYLERMQNNL